MRPISDKVWVEYRKQRKHYGVPKDITGSIIRFVNGNHEGLVEYEEQGGDVYRGQFEFGFKGETLVSIRKIERWKKGKKSGITREWLMGTRHPKFDQADRYEIGEG